jgi:hypothetical protein
MIKKSLDQSSRGINKLLFQREHTIFMIQSYYSNGNRGENGDWIYSPRLCLNEFRERLALL